IHLYVVIRDDRKFNSFAGNREYPFLHGRIPMTGMGISMDMGVTAYPAFCWNFPFDPEGSAKLISGFQMEGDGVNPIFKSPAGIQGVVAGRKVKVRFPTPGIYKSGSNSQIIS